MKRGEVRWYTFKAPDKRRPVLILTRSVTIRYLNTVTIAPITTKVRNIPSEVLLTTDEGMYTACAANLGNIQTVPQTKVGKLIAQLSSTRMEEVNAAISFALGLDELL
ncbi:MAG: type II toxin-antitoxin system PemK/MazF family toxin [Chloroflexi bacterium]|nr:type II toxin-antitoxin system PemK/MazF family toxin [Chloroflexota bacterium]MBU1662876.1 type II toxin-antitoxin system PemK/MazF family toxin [Chloroflexota bacterium]